MADDEKDNLREWMDIRSNFIQQEVNLINDLKQEKERIYAERILMKEERVNLEKLMKEIQNKQNEILSQQMYQNPFISLELNLHPLVCPIGFWIRTETSILISERDTV